MAKKRFSAENIITKLREAEVLTSQGKTIEEVCQNLGICDQIYYMSKKLNILTSCFPICLAGMRKSSSRSISKIFSGLQISTIVLKSYSSDWQASNSSSR